MPQVPLFKGCEVWSAGTKRWSGFKVFRNTHRLGIGWILSSVQAFEISVCIWDLHCWNAPLKVRQRYQIRPCGGGEASFGRDYKGACSLPKNLNLLSSLPVVSIIVLSRLQENQIYWLLVPTQSICFNTSS
jgi:hypothetical protein